eukprot:763505-Hanusia_phi.AAC.1
MGRSLVVFGHTLKLYFGTSEELKGSLTQRHCISAAPTRARYSLSADSSPISRAAVPTARARFEGPLPSQRLRRWLLILSCDLEHVGVSSYGNGWAFFGMSLSQILSHRSSAAQ